MVTLLESEVRTCPGAWEAGMEGEMADEKTIPRPLQANREQLEKSVQGLREGKGEEAPDPSVAALWLATLLHPHSALSVPLRGRERAIAPVAAPRTSSGPTPLASLFTSLQAWVRASPLPRMPSPSLLHFLGQGSFGVNLSESLLSLSLGQGGYRTPCTVMVINLIPLVSLAGAWGPLRAETMSLGSTWHLAHASRHLVWVESSSFFIAGFPSLLGSNSH